MWIDASDLEETYKERGGEYLEKYEAAWQTIKSADVSHDSHLNSKIKSRMIITLLHHRPSSMQMVVVRVLGWYSCLR